MRNTIIILILISSFTIARAQDEWTIIHPNTPTSIIMDTHFNSENEGWIVGQDGYILYTNDGGNTWESQLRNPDESYWGIHFADDNEGWVVGWRSIYHTNNKGATWEKQINPDPAHSGDLMDVYFINNEVGWIVGTYKTIFKTIDGGETWVKQMSQTGGGWNWLTEVVFTDELHGCAVGSYYNPSRGAILVTNDGGNTWTETIISSPYSSGFLTVCFKDSIHGWVSGYGVNGVGATLHRTSDGGITWQAQGAYAGCIDDIEFFNENEGLFLKDGSKIRRTFDGGLTWDEQIYTGSSSYFKKLTIFDNNKCIAAGDNGILTKSIDGAANWEEISSKMRYNISDLGFFSSFEGLAIGKEFISSQEGVLIKTNNEGNSWTEDINFYQYSFKHLEVIESTAYLLEKDSRILKTTDSGQSWDWYNVPQSPNNYNDMQFANTNLGFLCGDYGGLKVTYDGGNTWVSKNLSLTRHLKSLYFVNANNGVIIDEASNSLLSTTDGCESWNESHIEEHTLMDIFGLNDSTFFITTEEGVVYKTENNGDNWFEFFVFPEQSYNPKIFFKDELEGWYFNYTNIYHTHDGGMTWGNEQTFNEYGNPVDIFYLNDNSIWVVGHGGLTAIYDQTVGFSDYTQGSNNLIVFPNPTLGCINIELPNSQKKNLSIEIYSLNGIKVFENVDISYNNGYFLDISTLKSGTYIVQVKSNSGISLTKVVLR